MHNILEKMMRVLFFIWCIGVSVCEKVPANWAPYPASSVFTGEYGAPPLPSSSIQISHENVQYAGRLVEINPSNGRYVSKQFGQLRKPPVAFLPKETPPKPFRTTLNTGEVFLNPQQSSKLRNQQTAFSGNPHLPQFQQLNSFNPSSQQVLPSEYGPPSPSKPYPPAVPAAPTAPTLPPPSVHESVDEPPLVDNDDEENDDDAVIAVANASGRYYLLSKDNTLQRVVYQTAQTEDDRNNNGFTAHLHYSPVEPIRDPIYGYDDEGHLVRIYNKK